MKRIQQVMAWFAVLATSIIWMTPAAADAQRILMDSGLRPSHDGHQWSGPLPGGYAELAQFEAQLEQSGAHVAEVRIREPGLSGVFMQLMEAEAAQ